MKMPHQTLQHRLGDLLGAQVDLRQAPPERLEGRLPGQGPEVGADEAVGDAGQLVEIDVVGQGHAPGVDGEDLPTSLGAGQSSTTL